MIRRMDWGSDGIQTWMRQDLYAVSGWKTLDDAMEQVRASWQARVVLRSDCMIFVANPPYTTLIVDDGAEA